MDARLLSWYEDSLSALYIAVSEYGFGIDRCPAKAILLAQEHVGVDDPVRQMLLYEVKGVWDDEETEYVPRGWGNNSGPVWNDGVTPKLVGLTNTHQGWIRRKRI